MFIHKNDDNGILWVSFGRNFVNQFVYKHIKFKLNFRTDDNLADLEDVEWALEQLPNVVEKTKYDGWDHLGKDLKLKILNKHIAKRFL